MGEQSIVFDDPLAFIRRCVAAGRIRWTYHVTMRMKQRKVTRRMIRESTNQFEIIEAYPEDKRLPSFLVLGRSGGVRFHFVAATDVTENLVHIVTAYLPDPRKWNDDLRSRRFR